jgi:hypothetical protein
VGRARGTPKPCPVCPCLHLHCPTAHPTFTQELYRRGYKLWFALVVLFVTYHYAIVYVLILASFDRIVAGVAAPGSKALLAASGPGGPAAAAGASGQVVALLQHIAQQQAAASTQQSAFLFCIFSVMGLVVVPFLDLFM